MLRIYFKEDCIDGKRFAAQATKPMQRSIQLAEASDFLGS